MPQDVRGTHQELIAKGKLDGILRTNAIKETAVKVGGMLRVFIRTENQKRGNWSLPKPVLSYEISYRTITVPGAKGKYVKTAIEDVRHAVDTDHDLAIAIQEAINSFSQSLDEALDEALEDGAEVSNEFSIRKDADDDDDEDLNYYGSANDGIENEDGAQGQIPIEEDTRDSAEEL